MNPLATTLLLMVARGVGAANVAADGEAWVARIVIDGGINFAVAVFVHEAIGRATKEEALTFVIQLNTPGGLLPSTRAIVKEVIVYVAPSGGGGGSARDVHHVRGSSNIGAAHPVRSGGEELEGTRGEKVESFTASFGEAIARQRGRNVEWAAQSRA